MYAQNEKYTDKTILANFSPSNNLINYKLTLFPPVEHGSSIMQTRFAGNPFSHFIEKSLLKTDSSDSALNYPELKSAWRDFVHKILKVTFF